MIRLALVSLVVWVSLTTVIVVQVGTNWEAFRRKTEDETDEPARNSSDIQV